MDTSLRPIFRDSSPDFKLVHYPHPAPFAFKRNEPYPEIRA